MKGADTEGVCKHHKRDTSKNRAAGTGWGLRSRENLRKKSNIFSFIAGIEPLTTAE